MDKDLLRNISQHASFVGVVLLFRSGKSNKLYGAEQSL